MRLQKQCPYCIKYKKEESHKEIAGYRVIKFECGHSITEKLIASGNDYQFLDGSIAYRFQIENLEQAEKSGLRILIADEMGLGKTISSLLILKNHPEAFPAMIICKSSLTRNWFQEVVKKLGTDYVPQIISTSNEKPYGIFKIHIVSYDLLRRCSWIGEYQPRTVILDECQHIKSQSSTRTQKVREIVSGKIKRVVKYTPNLENRKKIEVIANDLMSYHGLAGRFILDFADLEDNILGLTSCRPEGEGIIKGKISLNKQHAETSDESEVIETILHEIAHAITPGAGHRPIWQETARQIGSTGEAFAWCKGTTEPITEVEQPKFIIALSGTPIKNRALEYFPVLNMIRPEIFPSEEGFKRQYLTVYDGGVSRLRYPEEFKNLTSEFIIRHESKDVMKDLPKIRRQYHYSDLGKDVEERYIQALKSFNEAYDDNNGKVSSIGEDNLLAKMAKLRHLTGLAKVDPCIDYLEDFLQDTDRKIVIWRHHDDVSRMLEVKLRDSNNPFLTLTSSMDGTEKFNQLERFRTGTSRIMIASTLSGGEGLNMQFMNDCIVLERQWNPANESQAEGRFTRIWNTAWGAKPDFTVVNSNYLVAVGTIDEFLAELVEKKRIMFQETMSGEGSSERWNQSELFQELADILRSKGGKRFGLS